ncbi:MAG: HTH domain-containing protein, partial [Bacteroidales bacterium]|nr:HTH domain-containing protein [Bacteroidales bacterium]
GTINLADLEEFSEIFAEDEDYKTIILHIAELGPVSAVDLSELLNIPLRTVARKIKLLKEKGVVEFAGAKKNGGYVLKKQ